MTERRDHGLKLLLVPSTHLWTAEWVAEALRQLGKLGTKSSNCVVFLADAARAWEWAPHGARYAGLIESKSELNVTAWELTAGPWSRASLSLWLTIKDQVGVLPDWLLNDLDALLTTTGGWDCSIRSLVDAKEKLKNGTPLELAEQLQSVGKGRPDLLKDLVGLPDALRVLKAVADAADLRQDDDMIDAEFVHVATSRMEINTVIRGLAWGELVGVLSWGAHGFVLNPLMKSALPRLLAVASVL